MHPPDVIPLRGVRVHNLQRIDVDLPVGKLTAITGVSGAGKSSLAFDTLYAEAQRRYLQSFSVWTRQMLERWDKPDAELIGALPAAVAVRPRERTAPGATVGSLTELSDYLALLLARAGISHCPRCDGEVRAQSAGEVAAAFAAMPPGTRVSIAFPAQLEPGEEKAWARALIEEGFVRAQVGTEVIRLGEQALTAAAGRNVWVLVDRLEVGTAAPERLLDSVETAFRRGDDRLALLTDGGEMSFDRRLRCPRCGLELPAPQPRLFKRGDPLAVCPDCRGTGEAEATPCPSCQATGWSEAARSVRLAGRNIAELEALTLSELDAALAPASTAPLTAPIVGEIGRRLELIAAAAADYLTLARSAESLSTGETQRLRLAAALASSLVGALYILDEPSAGLHEGDVERLTPLLLRLRDLGNTVVVVEHHSAVMQTADWVVDLGPGAAEEGGRVVYQGLTAGLRDVEDSLTGAYLFGRVSLAPAGKRRTPTAWLHLKGARLHNLQDVAVNFPLGVLCVVAGVSGAGKSALVEDTLYPLLARHKHTKDAAAPPPGATLEGASQVGEVVLIKPEAPPRSARSNPATYLKVFDDIRSLFAATTEAKIRNFGPGHFSFNQPGGRCETCEGQGTLAVDMQFLADVTMTCPECQGTRYKREVLAIKVRSLSVAEVLDLSVREAFRFFRAQPAVQHRLKRLIDVGLEYVRLGQSMDTLSSGEAQRLRLAGHFAAARKPRGLFILIEPAAGLHPADVETLTTCFHDLLATGQSLLVVEHNLNVIRAADHVIELGPGAGPAGGQVVAQGTPEAIAANPASATGRYLQADGPGPPP